MNKKDTLITRKEAAEMIGVSKKYVKNLKKIGRLFPDRNFPERWSKRKIERYIQEIS